MTKEIRVYNDPDRSIRFDRYNTFADAVRNAQRDVGVFYPARPTRVQLYVGRGWSLHMRGDWGRTVVTGDFSCMAEVNAFMKDMKEVAHE